MKKTVSLLFYTFLCLAFLLVTSCGSDDNTPTDTTVKEGSNLMCRINGTRYFFRILDSSNNTLEITWDRIDGATCVSSSCVRYSGNLVIPSKITYNGVTYTVTKVDDYAFYGSTSLVSVTFPSTIKELGSELFTNCGNLTSVVLNNGLTKIGSRAFANCTALTSVPLTSYLEIIGDEAFENCQNLISLTIPESVDSIGYGAFSGCKGLKSLTLNNSIIAISDNLFYGCSGLTEVEIPSKVTTIGAHAFDGCSSVATLKLGSSLTSIGMAAFGNCNNISIIYSYNLVPPTCDVNGVFSIYTGTLRVYNTSISAYKSATEWSNFGTVKGL
jgi:hypothetical protein